MLRRVVLGLPFLVLTQCGGVDLVQCSNSCQATQNRCLSLCTQTDVQEKGTCQQACGSAYLACSNACLGRQTTLPSSTGNTLPPTGTTTTTTTTTASGPYKGSIKGLRERTGLVDGLGLTLERVVVVSVAGNGKRFYVADPDGGPKSGIEVQLCSGCDAVCNPAPAMGAALKIEGVLNVSMHQRLRLEKPKVEDLGESLAVAPHPAEFGAVSLDSPDDSDLFGSYVYLTDGAKDAQFVVEDVTPGDVDSEQYKDVNASFPENLLAQCGANLTDTSTESCCPKCVGPRYFSFTVREQASGKVLAIATENYKSLDFVSWACSARDLPKAIKAGDKFTRLGGVYDNDFGKKILKLTRAIDYTIVK